jgi:hypothetical protein
MGIYVSENHMKVITDSHGDDDKVYRLGDIEPYEAYTDNVGKLFRNMQKEYGRCTGAVYIDTSEGTKKIGWVFRKREEYSDYRGRGDRYYTREVWVQLQEAEPERKTTIDKGDYTP